MKTKETSTLYTTLCNNIGQVKKENAQKEIDRLNKQGNTNSWRIDESDFMFVEDETDEDVYNPCKRKEGYVWVTCEPKPTKQIYITVVTSSLTMLANKVAKVLQLNEDIFDACSELANEIAIKNGLEWSNVLVQYFNHYSDEIPAMALKVPSKPKVICNYCKKPKNGVETGLCNHCGRFGLSKSQSTREQALAWWNNLPVWGNPSKEYYIGLYYSDDNVTPERIEQIWLKETQNHTNDSMGKSFISSIESQNTIKPNQKQYSQKEVDRLLDQQAARTTAQLIGNLSVGTNAKQFKQFDESLFKAYIDKLPESESLNMIKIIYENKLPDCKFKAHLDKWFKL